MKIGGSISFQLIEIFNIIENPELSEEKKREEVSKYQKSLKIDKATNKEGNGILIDKQGRTGQNQKDGFYIYGNIDTMSYESLLKVKEHVDQNLDSFTCEAEMKMGNVIKGYDSEKKEIICDFTLPDMIYKYAMSHGKKMRGHTLVWHKHEPKEILDKYIEDNLGTTLEEYKKQNPKKFAEKRKELTKQFLEQYIDKMGKQYPECYCWDVLNEIVPQMEINDKKDKHCPSKEEKKEGIRHSLWYEYLGKDFYIDVLQIARDKLPEGTKLFYNDFGEQFPEKQKAIIKMIKKVEKYEKKKKRTIIDGIGLQSHYDVGVKGKRIEKVYRDYSKLGKELQVTEIDVNPEIDNKGHASFDEEKAGKLWGKIFSTAKKYGVQVLTGWGACDDLHWFSHLQATSTMVDKDGNVKPFAKELVEKQKSPISQVKDQVYSEDEVTHNYREMTSPERTEISRKMEKSKAPEI